MMPLDDRSILVIGATGMLGVPVVNSLDHLGFPIRIFSRTKSKAESVFSPHYDIRIGDISNRRSLEEAMEGCFGVHINLKGGPSARDFLEIEYKGTERIIEAAKNVGVKRISYLSGATVSKENMKFPFIKAKYLAEQAILNSGLDYSIFRATWFCESIPLFVRNNQATIMGKQPHKWSWLAAAEFGDIVAKSFVTDEPINKPLYVLGPESYTFEEAFNVFKETVDMDIRISQLPMGVLSFFAAITFSKQLKAVLGLMKYFAKHPEEGDRSEFEETLGPPRISLREWCKLYKEQIVSKSK